MKYKMILSTIIVCFITMNANAGEIDGSAVLGSAIGAATGSALGSATGGKNGAILGGGLGGALGAAVGSSQSTKSTPQKIIVRERSSDYNDYNEHHDNGKHKGQYKNKHK